MADNLTREALQQELWNMLPDSCKKIMECLKETYLESLLADIDSYCQGQKQGPIWVKASEHWPEDHNKVHWRRVEDKSPLLIVGRNYQENIIAQFGWVYTPDALEWLDESAPVITNNDIIAALQKFVSRHEAGLLPDRFVYEQAKKALEGNQGKLSDLGEMEYRGPNSHCKACEDEAAGIKHISAQKHTCCKRRAKQ